MIIDSSPARRTFALMTGILLAASTFAQSAVQDQEKPTFKKGQVVQLRRGSSVYKNANESKLGKQVGGRIGTIISGPKTPENKSTSWYQVDWEIGVDGWCKRSGIVAVETDIEHGNKQVAKMVKDRPAMASFVNNHGETVRLNEEDELWKWCARRYGLVIKRKNIFWDNSEMDKPEQYAADHTFPTATEHGKIRLRTKTKQGPDQPWVDQSFDQLWSCAVFELINITNAGGFDRLYHKAIQGTIGREEYVEANQRLEYQALRGLNEFYKATFRPWAKARGYRDSKTVPLAFAFWVPDNYEEWIALYDGTNRYRFFYDYFDNSVVPYLKSIGKYDESKHGKSSETNGWRVPADGSGKSF